MNAPAAEFAEVAALEANWDGEGADRPSAVAIANAQRFLQEIASLGEPAIGPCSDGSIDLWWNAAPDRCLLMNFTAKGTAGFYSEIAGLKFKGTASATSAQGGES